MSYAFTIATRSFAVATALAITGCATANQWPDPKVVQFAPKPAQDPIELAAADLNAGRPGLAIQSLEKVLAQQPQSDRALKLLGTAFDSIGRHDLARTYFLRALAQVPASAELLHSIGYSYYLEQRYEEAAVYLRRAVASGDSQIEPLARGRLMVIESRIADTQPDPIVNVRVMLRRTGERTYELYTRCGDCTSPATMAEPAQSETAAGQQEGMPRYEISNGAGREKLAARIGHYLSAKGLQPYYLTNAANFGYVRTTLVYPQGAEKAAERVAATLPFKPLMSLGRGQDHVRLILGADILTFDAQNLKATRL
jgi:tetratricopeptide (TPR) repeat protein